MSLVVYAGAAQFMAVGLLAAGTGIAQIAILTLVINARHMVYGLSLLDRFAACRRFKAYLIFALTDETYGILTTVEPPCGRRPRVLLRGRVRLGPIVLGDRQHRRRPRRRTRLLRGRGMEFALTALFIVLLVEQIRSVRKVAP